MDRARAAAAAALLVLLLAATVALGVAAPAIREAALSVDAVVGWPPSTLVVSEIQTGGASASDEFAEIANMGTAAVDLAGLEVVYVTSTGGTVTRKAAWTAPLILEPGRHLVLANSSGVFTSIADATYSGGFAATGGAIALRTIGGAPLDAVGWGDATSTFVEGAAAPAPAAGSSLERRPGGAAGNTTDTNDNAADTFLQATPNPQNLAAPPVPAPGPSASPTPQPTATPSPTPTLSPSPGPTGTPVPSPDPSSTPEPSTTPTAAPTASPTPDPTPTPTPDPTATPEPSASPTAAPTSTPAPTAPPTPAPSPTPEPTATPEPSPSATATPDPSSIPAITIADARALPDGNQATVVGTLTTDLGALESARVGFVEDATAGIAVYLDAAMDTPLAAGTVVRLVGTLDERYGARTLRVAASAVVDLGPGTTPAAADVETGAVGETLEGRRVAVSGLTVGSPTSFADGLGVLVDDGSGPLRVIIGPDALGAASLPSGTLVRALGPVGQRDSTGTGTSGYRVHATEPGELEVLAPPPTPTPPPPPSPTPQPTPTPSPTTPPTPTPSPTPGPSATPSPTPGAVTIAEARAMPVGSGVTVTGVVTAEAGRLGTPSLLAIADGTGGLVIRVPEGMTAPARGRLVTVTGPTSAPYGQLEVRPPASGFDVAGTSALPVALEIGVTDLGEGSEGRLASLTGTVASAPRKATSGDITIDFVDAVGAPFRVMADASSRISVTDLVKGTTYRVVGIVGQRASAKGALDGYRLWLRDPSDISAVAGNGSDASPSPSASVTVIAIAAARLLDDAPAVVEGVITAGAGLLDDDGRRIVIQDASGAIEVYLAADTIAPAPGTHIRVAGTVGRAWDAPRLRATTIEVLGSGGELSAAILSGAPGESLEWQLVRIAGTLTDVTRLGDRWRADVRVGGASVLVTGLAGAGIASTSLVEGRAVTITGIVRRPYPTATDRRWTVVPRGPWDVAVGPAGPTSGSGTGQGTGSGGRGTNGTRPSPASAFAGVTLVDLATLGEHLGATVRVGGLVVAQTADGFTLDDGTAVGRIQLDGEAAAFLELIDAGDALGIVGRVVAGPDGEPIIVATDPAGLVRLGSLGEMVPLAAEANPGPTPSTTPGPLAAAGLGGPFEGFEGRWLGLAGLLVASAISLLVTIARRRQAHRRLVAAVAGRLSELRRPSGGA